MADNDIQTPDAPSDAKRRQMAPINTPTDLKAKATPQLQGSLNALLADSSRST